MSAGRAAWTVFAIVALVAAVVLAVGPASVAGVDCGTPLAPRHIELTDGTNGETVGNSTCARALSQRRVYAAGIGILGIIVLVGVLANARWTETPLHRLGRPVP